MTTKQKRALLEIARRAIADFLHQKKKYYPTREDFPDEDLWTEKGTFVTLTIDGNLRGCIGSIIPSKPLIIDVYDNAINAAFRDPRFPQLTEDELNMINIEISVLTVPQELSFSDWKELLDKVRPGVDGVIIRKGFYQATFLPQVWEEIPDKQSFFRYLCLKAGIEQDCFKDKNLEVLVYQVEKFQEPL